MMVQQNYRCIMALENMVTNIERSMTEEEKAMLDETFFVSVVEVVVVGEVGPEKIEK